MIERIVTAWKRWIAARRWHVIGCVLCETWGERGVYYLMQRKNGQRKVNKTEYGPLNFRNSVKWYRIRNWLNGGDMPEGTIR